MEEKEYSVSEAVRLIGVESHVLRYWEEELQVKVGRTSQGHRVYSEENIEVFRQAKRLKEKGIQLKAIRVLLESAPGSENRNLAETILEADEAGSGGRETSMDESSGQETRMDESSSREADMAGSGGQEAYMAGSGGQEENNNFCEIVIQEDKPDNLRQFEAILKQMIAEVVEEQNEKLKTAIADMIRDEIEELYLQYYQLPMEEAASARTQEKEKGWLGRVLQRLL